mmetsp:Transcript_17157/g.51282  ORF Transcript_17157/g.51282 Transcript_17157/m.51282 type:complete len:326 (-) Transcript_17157:65-1042(-)
MSAGLKSTVHDDASQFVIILDVNPFVWRKREPSSSSSFTFTHLLNELLVFCHAFCMLHHRNRLALICCTSYASRLVFPPRVSASSSSSSVQSSSSPALGSSPEPSPASHHSSHSDDLKEVLLTALQDLLEPPDDLPEYDRLHTRLGGALSTALCYISRKRSTHVDLPPRILIFQASPSAPSQYIILMNCIFSAQQLNVPIDVCLLTERDTSPVLQQACDMTSGVFVHPENPQSLLPYLSSVFLADRFSRGVLLLPRPTQVDYRPTCLCHRRVVDQGYVCSVCFSLSCHFVPVCPTCKTKFTLPLCSEESDSDGKLVYSSTTVGFP